MADKKRKKEETNRDPRIAFMCKHTTLSFALKPDKWPKMISNDGYLETIYEFFSTPEHEHLYFARRDGGALVPSLEYPPDTKTKAIFFQRSDASEITEDNFRRKVIVGDIPPNPVEGLSFLLQEVCVPLLTTVMKKEKCPETIKESVLNHVHAFQATVTEFQGKLKGETILPMPIGVENVSEQAKIAFETSGKGVDLRLKSAIQEVVTKWVHMIEEVIADDVLKLHSGEFPGPNAEIDFWNKRRKNLENLYEQLTQEEVQKIAIILESTQSAFYTAYKSIFTKVVAAVAEAKETSAYLRAFLPIIEKIESVDFVESLLALKEFTHCIFIFWSHSNYYSKGLRTPNFCRLFCNLFVNQCVKYLDPSSLFQGDPEETRSRIENCLEVLINLKEFILDRRAHIRDYFEQCGKPFKGLNFETKSAFERGLGLIKRLETIKDLLSAVVDYEYLDRIIIGGVNGSAHNKKIGAIYEEFRSEWTVFTGATYDVLDPESPEFKDEYSRFHSKSESFDRRLATIFVQVYDECYDISGFCKHTLVIGDLGERPLIRKEVGPKYQRIVEMANSLLSAIKKEYDKKIASMAAAGDFPPTADIVSWTKALSGQATADLEWILLLEPTFSREVDLTPIKNKGEEMVSLLSNVEIKAVRSFCQRATVEAELHLSKPVVQRQPNGLLRQNFDPALAAILREIKFLDSYGYKMPETLSALYSRDDQLFMWVQCTNHIVSWYNEILVKSKTFELGLVVEEIQHIDKIVNRGIELYDWNTPEAEVFILKIRQEIMGLHGRMMEAHENVKEMRDLLNQWKDKPLFVRDPYAKNRLGLSDRLTRLAERNTAVREASERIHELLDINYHLLLNLPMPDSEEEADDEGEGEEEEPEAGDNTTRRRARHHQVIDDDLLGVNDRVLPDEALVPPPQPPSKIEAVLLAEKAPKKKKKGKKGKKRKAKIVEEAVPLEPEPEPVWVRSSIEERGFWREYVEYIDNLVASAIINAIGCSVQYILSEMDTKSVGPLFQKYLYLHNEFVDVVEGESVQDLIEKLLNEMYEMAGLMKRIAPYKELPDYKEDVEESGELIGLRDAVLTRVEEAIAEADQYDEHLHDTYKEIWMTDPQEELTNFLRYGRTLTSEEVMDSKAGSLPESPPTLDAFREILDEYALTCTELNDTIKDCTEIKHWLAVNNVPFKDALLKITKTLIKLFKDHISDEVMDSITELTDMIDESEAILSVPVPEGDYDALVRVMDVLYQIRARSERKEDMFEPLKNRMELLQTYDVEFTELTKINLKELPEKWSKLTKKAENVKKMIQPLIMRQKQLVQQKINWFDITEKNKRERFRLNPFFSHNCENVFELVDAMDIELKAAEAEEEEIAKQAGLFEVSPPEKKHLFATRKDLKLVKAIWDFVFIIGSWFDEWNKSPWKNVDVEFMDMECKRFAKELRGLDKETRSWEVYTQTESRLKNIMTSLRAVTALQNPAIKARHWQQLMDATQVNLVMLTDTTLGDLLDLNLHEYEEDVKTIVDKSVKEMKMEKTLKELETTWKTMEFDRIVHDRTNIAVISANEELIETLENNQNQLQNMMSEKFVDHCLAKVTLWQKRLNTADLVTSLWMDVQRSWQHLESIFIGSEDIRSQLPTDTKNFEAIDTKFRSLLGVMLSNLNVVKATTKPGLAKTLEDLQTKLALCEKALSDYLETKRLVYPRFYFVSSADLLDILSNGNQPDLVAKHLTKLYDSLARLKFNPGTKVACGMYAKDGEYLPFKYPCDCSGKVEVWLNRVTEAMRRNLRAYLNDAVKAYDDSPRGQFLLDFPAQVALCATQISWSAEVNLALNRLGDGYENALKDYNKKQVNQLSALINMLLKDLSRGDRQKIMTVCTIDVHSRDVVTRMVTQRIDSALSFQWQSQLRHRWDAKAKNCFANICDAQFCYDYEYLGCTPRLVITPLTDRCYITLTQSLRLILGGAPAGPAGTGKTETTKDLGRALGCMVYVFNCSEQMDYKSCGNIYKGLAQTGAWGCFDEFNRISVEVLSVVAVQVKSILDSIKANRSRFFFMGEEINLVPTVGMFITMNPGYAGRTELPENLKALFRPCAMVVPDFELICEIMLVAEGFQDARILARKFITLYTLCRELLSKQDHYDWGLRAIKSVLVVAGSLKRGDRDSAEEQVLMRALRDFNIPKIVTDDLPIFLGLIGDLFPALDVPRKRDFILEKQIKEACLEMGLQAEENFITKCVQLEELFEVRHSVFIVGFAGTGKTQVWKTLMRTYANQKRRPIYNDLNPKAVTNDELFGAINPATREWRDGLFSVIMREQANLPGDGPKWIVLDGDIDPMWIESLNTLMDDNKVLTLASNERIALTPSMRLLFEISNLKTATPATVSRAGILYINPTDLGWNPFITSWIDTRQEAERLPLIVLFDRYVPPCLEALKTKFKKITPLPDINHLQVLCQLLNCLLVPENLADGYTREQFEMYFAFACVWAFGGAVFQDQMVDWRNEFSKWFQGEFKSVKFPYNGNVFSFYIEAETNEFRPWSNIVQEYHFDPDLPLQSTLVSTTETTRLRFLMDLLLEAQVPIMLVGGAGSGKSVLVGDKMSTLPETYTVTNVPFNFYTTSEMLQKVLEKPLEKKAGRNFGPPGNKRMIYFIDDMNMPEVDSYGTVQPHTLVRQHIDYNHWYDRTKLTLKEVHKCQYVSCMNPTAGSFTIDPRLQRHFAVFAVSQPSGDALQSIYEKILDGHLSSPLRKFSSALRKIVTSLVAVALLLHQKMAQSFLPTAIKFHYMFNMRDLANIFQGVLFSSPECIPTPNSLIRLWMHEAYRVYCDKLVDEKDIKTFRSLITEFVQKGFEDLDETEVLEEPLLYCHFAEGIGESKYLPVPSWPAMNTLLEEAQSQYNERVAAADLVLFEDAMHHICRINRILEAPRGNALLVGVGGSGKQSLSRLAAFISSLEVYQIQLKKGYSIIDLKADLAKQYIKTGLKNTGVVFLMTDAQVADEKFLVLINDCLASGEIPELFADEEVEEIINNVRNEVKGAGIPDTRENCWRFFIDKVRRLLKVVLCFSPVGSTLRVRARKFPAVVNCTAVDWFHKWPQDALISVSKRFLADVRSLPTNLHDSVSEFMAHVHTSVNSISDAYLTAERRYNYTTPKSFLEQIALYGKLLESKTEANTVQIKKLKNGLKKLQTTADEVAGLQKTLSKQEAVLKEKNRAADDLIAYVRANSEIVAKEKAIAAEEEGKVRVIEEDVTIKQRNCEEDLRKAMPALQAAQEALDTLDKGNLTEYKSFGTPPPGAEDVAAAVMVLFAKSKIPRVQDRTWKNAKVMMGKVDTFLDQLKNYDKDNMKPEAVKAVQVYLDKPDFKPEKVMAKSKAAAGLCSWVINIIAYYKVFKEVEPKRLALKEANEELADARSKQHTLMMKVAELQGQLTKLQQDYDIAAAEKRKCQEEADATIQRIDLANRMVNGLSKESVRWRESLSLLKSVVSYLPGDILLTTAFISYLGCFTRKFRVELIEKHWRPFMKSLDPVIPMTEGADHLALLTDDAQIAAWSNEGLPGDRMSVENATILVNSARWPLMIDPQLQGLKWIKAKYGDNLQIVRLGQKMYMETIEKAISDGATVLIENIGETVDAVLDPLLSRALIRKGTVIKIGDKEVDFNPKFRLILQTKLANPHYQPEMQAQTTLINFTVTRDGLEEQLLGEVVKAEKSYLEESKRELTQKQNEFKITLKVLEEDLLTRLNNAGDDIAGDGGLVENLEKSAQYSANVKAMAMDAKETSANIDRAREQYRPVATRASLLYFVLNDLNKINPIYQFSLKAFTVVFNKAIADTPSQQNLKDRVLMLLDTVTFCVFKYTSRALFEKDKLIFTAHMAVQILLAAKEIEPEELDFLLRYPADPNTPSVLDFLSSSSWGGIKTLSLMIEFKNLNKDIEVSAKRWRKLVESEKPEREKFPGEWKDKTALQRLCIMRCLRPDRMTYAVAAFIEEKLGVKYVEARTANLQQSYDESTAATPIFFILSPGVDPSKDVERLGRQLGFTQDSGRLHNVSLGQGQEIVAENAMEDASRHGHWVILQNVHLVKNWLPTLEKKMEQCVEGAHEDYRLFISAEPAPTPESHIIPQGILESAIKITNEPPTGMLANLHKALDNFDQPTLERSSKESEFKAILFSLCYFHAVVAERRKFGAQGWNRVYPFNVGDLRISSNVLYNYLENNSRVPWEDLRYLFGEIMYGGHITDDWDRRLCRTYLEEYMKPDLVDAELWLAPGFLAPPNLDHPGYKRYVDMQMPAESPTLYGLHLNAEIGFQSALSEDLFRTLLEMQPRDAGKDSSASLSREDKVKTVIDDIMDKVPEEFNIPEMMARVEDKTPYVLVAFQELERMNMLFSEIKRSLRELALGLKGELTISADMETLMGALFLDQVPASWSKLAYPSLLPLGGWLVDLVARLRELEVWSADFSLPPSVWLSGFFNPQSFLTAIMQSTARRNGWPLDKMCLHFDVTKKSREEILTSPKDGACVHGLFMEGARWDIQTGSIMESRVKELYPAMPVITIKAITQDKQDTRMVYECPLYKTRQRGPTFVWTFNLKSRDKPAKWTLAGVALLLSK